MDEVDLDRQEQTIMQNIAKKKAEEDEQARVQKLSSSAEDAALKKPRRKSRWDDSGPSDETPKRGITNALKYGKSVSGPKASCVPVSRWDATPVAKESAWDETPKTESVSSTPSSRRSRWDETPKMFVGQTPVATPMGGAGMTPTPGQIRGWFTITLLLEHRFP